MSHSSAQTLARWCALAPEKSLRGCELTIAALGATAGSRCPAMSTSDEDYGAQRNPPPFDGFEMFRVGAFAQHASECRGFCICYW